nr:MAG TPA: hypothetical protein [Crassvirales sp.]
MLSISSSVIISSIEEPIFIDFIKMFIQGLLLFVAICICSLSAL